MTDEAVTVVTGKDVTALPSEFDGQSDRMNRGIQADADVWAESVVAAQIGITLGFGMVLGFRVTTSPWAAVTGCALVLAFALAMCWLSALIGLLARTPQGVQIFGFTAMFPIVFASGILVPIQTMPGWLQAFARWNPMTLLSQACRGLMTGGAVAVPAGQTLLWAVGILAVFAPLAARAYRRKS